MFVNFSYDSVSGRYEIFWKWNGIEFDMNVSIPNGCKAEIVLPNGDVHSATAGKYQYQFELTKNIYSPFAIDTPIIDLIKNEEASNVMKELIPQIYMTAIEKGNDRFKVNSISSANLLPNFAYPPDTIKECDEKLSKIKPWNNK